MQVKIAQFVRSPLQHGKFKTSQQRQPKASSCICAEWSVCMSIAVFGAQLTGVGAVVGARVGAGVGSAVGA
jgi:hypothetical protein